MERKVVGYLILYGVFYFFSYGLYAFFADIRNSERKMSIYNLIATAVCLLAIKGLIALTQWLIQ